MAMTRKSHDRTRSRLSPGTRKVHSHHAMPVTNDSAVDPPNPQGAQDRETRGALSRFPQIIGTSAALERVLEQVQRVAPTDATVLVLGETGTGKELIAQAAHTPT